jgi:hypothetical protein
MKKEKKLTPLEAVNDAIVAAMIYCGGSYTNRHGMSYEDMSEGRWKSLKPGALIERMPESVRKVLRQLKSHHFDALPMDRWRFEDDAYCRKQRVSEMLMEFDKKLNI